jgi:hypothetical protein
VMVVYIVLCFLRLSLVAVKRETIELAKASVIGSLRSRESQRGYRHAIDEFIDWYCSEPRLSFNRTVVLR